MERRELRRERTQERGQPALAMWNQLLPELEQVLGTHYSRAVTPILWGLLLDASSSEAYLERLSAGRVTRLLNEQWRCA